MSDVALISPLCLHSHTGPVGTSAAALEPQGHGQQPSYESTQDPLVWHAELQY